MKEADVSNGKDTFSKKETVGEGEQRANNIYGGQEIRADHINKEGFLGGGVHAYIGPWGTFNARLSKRMSGRDLVGEKQGTVFAQEFMIGGVYSSSATRFPPP